jgi:YD repeat-containing protein
MRSHPYAATFTYNAVGELIGASDPNSVYTYSLDADGRITQTQVSYPGASGLGTVTLSYNYDALGNRTSMSDSSGGYISYSYGPFQ